MNDQIMKKIDAANDKINEAFEKYIIPLRAKRDTIKSYIRINCDYCKTKSYIKDIVLTQEYSVSDEGPCIGDVVKASSLTWACPSCSKRNITGYQDRYDASILDDYKKYFKEIKDDKGESIW